MLTVSQTVWMHTVDTGLILCHMYVHKIYKDMCICMLYSNSTHKIIYFPVSISMKRKILIRIAKKKDKIFKMFST